MISAPRVETVSSPDSSQEQYAGQPEHVTNKRLARAYDVATFLGYSGTLVAIFTILVQPETFYAMGAAAYVFYAFVVILALMTSADRKREEADELCAERWDTICKLHSEIGHLKQDVEHLQISLQRGSGGAAAGSEFGGLSRKPAAVVEFPNPKGAA
jgi:hypothetical protein